MHHDILRHRGVVTIAASLLLTIVTMFPSRSDAAVDADLRAGVYTDNDAVAFGGGLLTGVGDRWFFNPNLEAAFADRGNLFTLNADFHYDLPTTSAMSFYMGLGPALLIADPDGGDSDSDVGLNLVAGLAGLGGAVRPFGQIKGIIKDGSELAIVGGIRF